MLEKLLIDHCSPTLASLKMANLAAISFSSDEELVRQIAYWNRELAEKGVTILVVKKKPGWALLYVCRKHLLQKRLRNREIAEFLREYGYGDTNVEDALACLMLRLAEAVDFPHEIGVFLDYPIEDVKGFIRNKGRNFKCQGCWKVYSNECEKQKLFAKYHKCRRVYQQLWKTGTSVRKLTVAA